MHTAIRYRHMHTKSMRAVQITVMKSPIGGVILQHLWGLLFNITWAIGGGEEDSARAVAVGRE